MPSCFSRFLVLADDLTGAGDSAVALLRPQEQGEVLLDGWPVGAAQDGIATADPHMRDIPGRDDIARTAGAEPYSPDLSAQGAIARIAAVDLHTRDLSVQEAGRRVAEAAACAPAGRAIFKKIDSTLRGHIGAELAALCANVPAQALPVVSIVAPAFPDLGRTLIDGVLHIQGKPADPAAMWHAGVGGCREGLAAELGRHGFHCTSLSLAQVRDTAPATLAALMAQALVNPRPAIVCDASSNDDMLRIVAAASALPARCVWVGSAGLAQALAAAATSAEPPQRLSIAQAKPDGSAAQGAPGDSHAGCEAAAIGRFGGLAVMVGSFSAVAGEQVRSLVEAGGCVHVAVPPDELIGVIAPHTALRIDRALQDGRTLVLSIASGKVVPEVSKLLSAGMAALAAELLPRLAALICCGGDTSRALLDRIGARRLRVSSCAEPGATLAWSATHPALRLVMKAGAFGDAQTLVRLQTELRAMPPLAAPASTRRNIVESNAKATNAASTSATNAATNAAKNAQAAHDAGEKSSTSQPPGAPGSADRAARPIVAITMGDAAGVGPEIIVRALASAEVYRTCRPLVIGDAARLEHAARIVGKPLAVRRIAAAGDGLYALGAIDCVDLALIPPDTPFGQLSAVCGDAAFQFIERAVKLAMAREVDAICTAPLNKEALHAGGHIYPGHTELLAELTGTPEVSMMLSSPQLKVIHVTTHIGLLDAIERIEPKLVGRVIGRIHDTLQKSGIDKPRIGVCGINPHAGENGLFGRGEEATKIIPAIQEAVSRGIDVEGPLPADTLFFRAARGDFDGVVAMYHDQGHGPVKVMGLESGVNVTIGLPVIRTSVDHGTAFDIAGKGVADEGSLIEALRQAIALAPRGRA